MEAKTLEHSTKNLNPLKILSNKIISQTVANPYKENKLEIPKPKELQCSPIFLHYDLFV